MTDPIESLVKQIASACMPHQTKIVTAESCTGGMISTALTDISGSSAYFDRGFVTYSDEAKAELLNVSLESLSKHGAVSEAVAMEMALGALKASQADIALSVTGIAGPTGGSDKKPVGLVYFGLAYRAGENAPEIGFKVTAYHEIFKGDRAAVRRQTQERGLKLILKYLTQ
jgi:nicotinamide-nucleotide amidase